MTQKYNLAIVYASESSFVAKKTSEFLQNPKQVAHETNFSLSVKKLSEKDFEVKLNLNVDGQEADTKEELFSSSVSYAGVFEISGFNEHDFNKIIRTNCSIALYPYARERITNLVNASVFSNVVLPIINFHEIYEKQVEAEKNKTS